MLNDEWVSHPTWASEESGFIAHKKNQFEDTLHKSEEERHEYQVHIEALSRTIALLEPLEPRIEEMSPEERAALRLKPDLGGPSKMVYWKTLKKVYGRDAAPEVIRSLQDNPAVAVPVVLARLKQKDEEWRRAQREWSRTWREVDAKNFYKALDHQGIVFKTNDKKSITAKHFVQEIEGVRAKQASKRLREWRDRRGQSQSRSIRKEDGHTPANGHRREKDGDRDSQKEKDKERDRDRDKDKDKDKDKEKDSPLPDLYYRGSLGAQLEYNFSDTGVLHDTLKLIYAFLDHSTAQYSVQERRGIERFLGVFIPLVFRYPGGEFEGGYGYGYGEGYEPMEDVQEPEREVVVVEVEKEEEKEEGEDVRDRDHRDRAAKRSSGNATSTHLTTGTGGSGGGGVSPVDLRKRLLKTVQESSSSSSASPSQSQQRRARPSSRSAVQTRSSSPGSRSRRPSPSGRSKAKTKISSSTSTSTSISTSSGAHHPDHDIEDEEKKKNKKSSSASASAPSTSTYTAPGPAQAASASSIATTAANADSRSNPAAAAAAADVWVREAAVGSPSAGETPTKRRPLYTNTTFYTLLRLVQVSESVRSVLRVRGGERELHIAGKHTAFRKRM